MEREVRYCTTDDGVRIAYSVEGEGLVSDTVRGLARTSAGVTFEDRGRQKLKGVADPQRPFAVRGQTDG